MTLEKLAELDALVERAAEYDPPWDLVAASLPTSAREYLLALHPNTVHALIRLARTAVDTEAERDKAYREGRFDMAAEIAEWAEDALDRSRRIAKGQP